MSIKISRRDLLQIGCGTAAMGVAARVGDRGSTRVAAQARLVGTWSTAEATSPPDTDAQLFFRDDWHHRPSDVSFFTALTSTPAIVFLVRQRTKARTGQPGAHSLPLPRSQ